MSDIDELPIESTSSDRDTRNLVSSMRRDGPRTSSRSDVRFHAVDTWDGVVACENCNEPKLRLPRHAASVRLAASSGSSARAVADEESSRWRVMPYLWFASFDGTVGTPPGGGDPGDGPEGDFGQLWDNLRLGGAMCPRGPPLAAGAT